MAEIVIQLRDCESEAVTQQRADATEAAAHARSELSSKYRVINK
jgi:hypothetical protein